MNKKKVIGHLMMQTIEEAKKARNKIQEFIDTMNHLEDDDELLLTVDVCLQNIDYYARMIIEKDGAL